jgi:N-methylhydantoinase A
MSAVGFLAAPLAFDFVRSLPGGLDTLDWEAVQAAVAAMEAEGRAILGRSVPQEAIAFRRYADMRYRKQGDVIRVPIPAGPLDATRRAEIRASFEATYRGLYGHTVAGTPIDVVSWRVVASGPRPRLELARLTAAGRPEAARKGTRRAFVAERRDYAEVPVYDRYALAPGSTLAGPAIVEERESTVVIGEGAGLRVDPIGTLVVDLPR